MIKGIILDIDGTLIFDNQAIPGAAEAVQYLIDQQYQVRFATNTTGKTPQQIAQRLHQFGIHATAAQIDTSVTACLRYIERHLATKKACLLLPENTLAQFNHLNSTMKNPDYIVMGDLDNGFNYEQLNCAFANIKQGAQLLAFHRNPYYRTDGGWALDSGAFTHALEYATQTEAIITGKPSATFFEQSLATMGLPAQQVLVVGDDITTDIAGANTIGCLSVLVTTGKAEHWQPNPHLQPIPHIRSIADLPTYLAKAKLG